MKNSKFYFLIALIASSAYLLQRALLILTGKLDISASQEQPQVQGVSFGLDVSFSYLGMNIYWPFIIALCIFGYKVCKVEGEHTEFMARFEAAAILKNTLVVLLPVLALMLHFVSILPFTFEQVATILAPFEDFQTNGQGLNKAPSVFKRLASTTIVLLTVLSLVAPVYASLAKGRVRENA